jgi:hypothetical protein
MTDFPLLFPDSEQLDIYCAGSFLTLLNLKANALAFGQRFPTCALNRAEVDEYISPFIILDKTKALFVIKPFNFSLCQSRTLLFLFH